MTLIAFIGSVFSPYYAWANRNGPVAAENYCAMNVALYRRRGGYWAMTERGSGRVERSADGLRIGPSSLLWDGAKLSADIDERCAPLPRRLRGKITVTPGAMQSRVFALDAAARHRWQPIAPGARVEVAFQSPEVAWSGNGYFDSNDGDVALADDFSAWHWARLGDKIIYDVAYRDGGRRGLALQVAADGSVADFVAPPEQRLPGSLWGVERMARADAGHQVRVLKTLEDAPFYARSMIETRMGGEVVRGVHESLSLKRFSAPWVRALLPFRMPRFG